MFVLYWATISTRIITSVQQRNRRWTFLRHRTTIITIIRILRVFHLVREIWRIIKFKIVVTISCHVRTSHLAGYRRTMVLIRLLMDFSITWKDNTTRNNKIHLVPTSVPSDTLILLVLEELSTTKRTHETMVFFTNKIISMWVWREHHTIHP